MGLFKKKPGGTVVGNLLRGIANKATGGILGNGKGRIPAGSTDGKTIRELEQQAAAINIQNPVYSTPPITSTSPGVNLNDYVKLPTVEHSMKPQTLLIVGGIVLLFLFMNKKM